VVDRVQIGPNQGQSNGHGSLDARGARKISRSFTG